MKKIINGRLYSTDTARELGLDAGGDGVSHWCETLYQKRTGEYFLHGEGGPMTKYAVSVSDNNWSGGEKIIPLSAAKARKWAEEHLEADQYAQIFAMPDEGVSAEVLHVQIDAALAAKLRQTAADKGISLKACLEEILRNL